MPNNNNDAGATGDFRDILYLPRANYTSQMLGLINIAANPFLHLSQGDTKRAVDSFRNFGEDTLIWWRCPCDAQLDELRKEACRLHSVYTLAFNDPPKVHSLAEEIFQTDKRLDDMESFLREYRTFRQGCRAVLCDHITQGHKTLRTLPIHNDFAEATFDDEDFLLEVMQLVEGIEQKVSAEEKEKQELERMRMEEDKEEELKICELQAYVGSGQPVNMAATRCIPPSGTQERKRKRVIVSVDDNYIDYSEEGIDGSQKRRTWKRPRPSQATRSSQCENQATTTTIMRIMGIPRGRTTLRRSLPLGGTSGWIKHAHGSFVQVPYSLCWTEVYATQ
ncbi:hypothetical protein F4604DRAFT_1676400 [Suillus subluteus]|nr:hypothetical protein F4604DRAFT_1676400 [Suillus subluteus]